MARRTFFSFHYEPDCRRAWNVRNSWVVRPAEEVSRGFFDGSVFEASKREGEQSLKAFLRKGLENTSVTCVLAGTVTWKRRWVRYEIARSVLKGNGLLTVHIHGVKDMKNGASKKGSNPLAAMGLYRTAQGVYFAEWSGGKWIRYLDYSKAVPESDLWFASPPDKKVVALSTHYSTHDFITDDGRANIGTWIETAAKRAGR
jgi:hypothetical protein